MKVLRNLKFVNHVALLALALCFSAGLGKAQNAYEGKFTLPFEAHWAGAVLPAGDYTISMPSANSPYLLYVRGEGKTAIILANGTNTKTVSEHSQLTIANNAGDQVVTMLEAGQLGLVLDYPVSKSKMKHMAGSAGGAKPMTSEVIPVRGAYGFASGR